MARPRPRLLHRVVPVAAQLEGYERASLVLDSLAGVTVAALLAQKQLVILKNGKPVGRYVEGEYVYFVMKDGSRKEGAILELLEFAAIISRAPKGDPRAWCPSTPSTTSRHRKY